MSEQEKDLDTQGKAAKSPDAGQEHKEKLTQKQQKKLEKKQAKEEKLKLKRQKEAASDEKLMKILGKVSKNFYPLISACMVAVAVYFIYFFYRGNEALASSDFWGQYYDFMRAFRRAVMEGGSPFFNWSLGSGQGTIGSVAYFLMSPFNVIALVFPEEKMFLSLSVIITLKLAAAAFTYAWAAKKVLNRHGMEVIIFSFAYALCGFCLSYYYIFMWLDAVILFPVVCIMIKQLILKRHWIGLTVTLFILFVANFYMAYMVGVVSFFVFCGMYYYYKKEKGQRFFTKSFWKCFGQFIGCAVIAALSCMALVLPALSQLSGRFGFGKSEISLIGWLLSDPFTVYRQLFLNTHETLNMGEVLAYTGTLTAFLLPLYFLSKKINKREKRVFGAILVIFVLMIMLSPLNAIMYAGTSNRYYQFRYAFLLSGILSAIGCRYFPCLQEEKLPRVFKVVLFNLAYLSLYFVAVHLILKYKDVTFNINFLSGKKAYWEDQTWVCFAVNLAAILLTGGTICLALRRKMQKRQMAVALYFLLVMEIVVDGVFLWTARKQDYVAEENWQVNAKQTSDKVIQKELAKLPEEGFYRVEKNWDITSNDNVGTGMRGLSYFTSTDNAGWEYYMQLLGIYRMNAVVSSQGLTEVSKSLLNIRYMFHMSNAVYQMEELPQNGYDDFFYVEENKTCLPLGFMVSGQVNELPYVGDEDINPFEQQENILAAMLGRDKVQCYYPVKYEEEPALLFMEEYELEDGKKREGMNTYQLDEGTNSGVIKYRVYQSHGKGVYYAYIYAYDVLNTAGVYQNVKRTVTAGDGESYKDYVSYHGNAATNVSYITSLTGDADKVDWDKMTYDYYAEDGSFVRDKDCLSYSLIVSGSPYQVFGDPYFYYYDEEAFRKIYEELASEPFQVTDYDDTHVKGTVNVTDRDYLYISIPYEKSWNVYVDGKQEEVAALMYGGCLGVKLAPGEHEVEFIYEPEGLGAGTALSVIGFSIFAMCIAIHVKSKFVHF